MTNDIKDDDEYCIVVGLSIGDLVKKVNEKIKESWRVSGGVFLRETPIRESTLNQPMVRYIIAIK